MALAKKKSIKTTILLIILLGVLFPILILIVVSGMQYKRQSEEIAKNKALAIANEYANNIENKLNELFTAVNTFADIQSSMILDNGELDYTSEQISLNQIKILKQNPQSLALYSIYLNGRIKNPNTGELNETLALLGNTQYKNKISPLIKWNYSFKSNVPDTLRKGNGYMLIPPYFDVYENDTLLMITYGHEIKYSNEIVGLVGSDIAIDWIQDIITATEIFNNKGEISIISDRGIINADSKSKTNIGKHIGEILPGIDKEKEALFSSVENNIQLDEEYIFYVPIEFAKLIGIWHVRIAVPEDEIISKALTNLRIRIVIAIIIALISLAITYFYFNKLVARIRKLGAAAKRMAKGNLFIDFETVGNDEITDLGKSLQAIITRFNEIISSVKATMEQFRESGNALSSTAVKLSEGASEQASSTQEVSASMEQMSANIEQNAENAKTADKIAQKSSIEIEESSKNVKLTASSMDDIASKTSIIGDIAFQVNILALNAAVEAARAGVHGKGFGVVANEVGKLADRSKLAASEIDELTNKSFLVAKKSGKSLEDIVPEIKKTAQLVQYITNASMEQKSGASQINNAIQQLNTVTQQNASIAENLTSNVESLSMLSDKLNKLIAFFKLEARQKRKRQDRSSVKENRTQKPRTEQKKEVKSEKPVTEKKVEAKKDKLDGTVKKKQGGIDLDLGVDDSLDDGFEKF